MNCTLVLIPGLLSDKRVWAALANIAERDVSYCRACRAFSACGATRTLRGIDHGLDGSAF